MANSPTAAPPRFGFVRSLVGMKALMAVTGVILFLFVVGHLLGNLKVFQGAEHFNAYAEGLRTVGAPFFARGQVLWAVRLVLLASVGLHVWAAVAVTLASWQARPVEYHQLELIETTYAARTMRWGGVLILLYVVYHLLDLTFGAANPSFVPGDAYHNLVASLRRWPAALAYIGAVSVVGFHIQHGLWSAFQTLGVNRPPTPQWRRGVAGAIAALITAGYIAIPVAVLAGVVR
jgi:succinate dehydrogenase / fumarate reductase, cytochrome b subunit